MKIPLTLLTTLLAACFSFAAWANNTGAHAAFLGLNRCIQQGTDDCHGFITTGSSPLYDRLKADGLMRCIPKDAAYLSEEPAGSEIIVRASTMINGKQRIMRLHFAKEQGAWKLDISSSLQAGIGDGWQQKVDMTEQVYLALRKQLGTQMDCSMLQNMVRK